MNYKDTHTHLHFFNAFSGLSVENAQSRKKLLEDLLEHIKTKFDVFVRYEPQIAHEKDFETNIEDFILRVRFSVSRKDLDKEEKREYNSKDSK